MGDPMNPIGLIPMGIPSEWEYFYVNSNGGGNDIFNCSRNFRTFASIIAWFQILWTQWTVCRFCNLCKK